MNQQIIQGVRFHPDQMEEGAIYAISKHSSISHNYHFQSLLPSLWVKMVQANQHYYKPWLLLLIFNPEGGTRNYHFSTYQSNTNLNQAITLIKGSRKEKWGYYFKAESFYNVATMEEEYALERSEHYHQMSHGESFLTLIQKEFCDNVLYF